MRGRLGGCHQPVVERLLGVSVGIHLDAGIFVDGDGGGVDVIAVGVADRVGAGANLGPGGLHVPLFGLLFRRGRATYALAPEPPRRAVDARLGGALDRTDDVALVDDLDGHLVGGPFLGRTLLFRRAAARLFFLLPFLTTVLFGWRHEIGEAGPGGPIFALKDGVAREADAGRLILDGQIGIGGFKRP